MEYLKPYNCRQINDYLKQIKKNVLFKKIKVKLLQSSAEKILMTISKHLKMNKILTLNNQSRIDMP